MTDFPEAKTSVSIGNRLELLVDDFLLDSLKDASLTLHPPRPREVALVTDRPWEGTMCGYVTVLRHEPVFRMYYKTFDLDLSAGKPGKELVQRHPWVIACAESRDGIQWNRPALGLYDFQGSRDNNIVWNPPGPERKGIHGFTPFRDANPDCAPEVRYKAMGASEDSARYGLFALRSPDGIRWELMQGEPVMQGCAFDSQNLAFWDSFRREYRAYVRDCEEGWRGIKTATSKDFLTWSEPEWLEYPGTEQVQLYTNQIQPYFRAPHIFLGFPTRYTERRWSPEIEALPELEHRRLRSAIRERFGSALTDGLFMSSRDGQSFRRWDEAFLRPGPRSFGNWAYGDNYQCCGMLETVPEIPGGPAELSFFVTENYWRTPGTVFRRYALRMDGFVSVRAGFRGGELLTKPVRYDGTRLFLNFSTSAAGSIRVEIQDAEGRPQPGYSLQDCHEVIGDEIARIVAWKAGNDLNKFAGSPIRLRFFLKDADLCSLRFA